VTAMARPSDSRLRSDARPKPENLRRWRFVGVVSHPPRNGAGV
jgi:hypothetical protein